jgi:hypothetical protein
MSLLNSDGRFDSCAKENPTSPYCENQQKTERLLASKRILNLSEIAHLISEGYEPQELYDRKLISIQDKKNLETNRI